MTINNNRFLKKQFIVKQLQKQIIALVSYSKDCDYLVLNLIRYYFVIINAIINALRLLNHKLDCIL